AVATALWAVSSELRAAQTEPATGRWLQLPRQWPLHVRQSIRDHRHHGGIFRQFFGHNFVQRIGCRVVIVEVETVILNRTKSRHASFLERLNVGPAVFNQIEYACS